MENDQEPLDGIEPPTQSKALSYARAVNSIQENELAMEAPVSTALRTLMDHASFLVLLRECVSAADQRFGDYWHEEL